MNERKEVSEAITAGRQALSILRMAKDELRSAGNWGVVDMVGGGFFSGMMKHSKINHASSYMRMAKEKLLIFQRELKDVYISTDMDYDKLQKYRIIDRLFTLIGDDLKEYQKIFNMCEQDFNSNYLSTPSFVQRQINKVTNYFGKYVDELTQWLNGLDEKKIVEALKELADR